MIEYTNPALMQGSPYRQDGSIGSARPSEYVCNTHGYDSNRKSYEQFANSLRQSFSGGSYSAQ